MALATAAVPAASAAPVTAQVVKATHTTQTLHKVGVVNLKTIAAADAKHAKATAPGIGSTSRHEAPLRLLQSPKSAARTASPAAPGISDAGLRDIVGSGTPGFDGLTSSNSAASNPAIGDVSPPDQGLGVGPGPNGTAVVEFVNMALNIYSTSGKTLLGAVPAYQVFGLTPDAFLSDPRVYWDPQSHHWFLTMFTFGDGVTAPLSQQFIDVSLTKSPFGPYAIFSIPTDDSSNTAGGCPCYGDFDQVGADNSGFYIATNEFSVNGPNFNGTIIYAMSKGNLIKLAQGQPVTVIPQVYSVPADDPFGSYHLSPSSVTQGSASPNTEYFVESNGNLPYDGSLGSGLEVFALLNTSVLSSNQAPPLVATSVATKPYSQPPNAAQKDGPTPLGDALGQPGVVSLQTDFNAVQEVTYADGWLYGELSTGFNFNGGQNSGALWFVLKPSPKSDSVGAKVLGNGYVKTSQDLLYPVIGVDHEGDGFMALAVSGPGRFPSAAFVKFNGSNGAVGPVHIAAKGVNPLDDFTCYLFPGGCRYGDYSMAQNLGGRIYMATEYVAPQPRDPFSNWGTRVWSAAAP